MHNNLKTIYQISTIQAISYGDYHGHCSLGDILMNGDTGIGYLENLNGELIILDSVCYSAQYDGNIKILGVSEQSPFACITQFSSDFKASLFSIYDIDTLTELLNSQVKKSGSNNIYCVKIEGNYNDVTIRCIKPQQKPFKPFNEVMATDEKKIKLENIEGTIIGMYYPDYLGYVNKAGWNFFFISKDRKKGGQVLNLSASMVNASFDLINDFNLEFPESNLYQSLQLTHAPVEKEKPKPEKKFKFFK